MLNYTTKIPRVNDLYMLKKSNECCLSHILTSFLKTTGIVAWPWSGTPTKTLTIRRKQPRSLKKYQRLTKFCQTVSHLMKYLALLNGCFKILDLFITEFVWVVPLKGQLCRLMCWRQTKFFLLIPTDDHCFSYEVVCSFP